MNNLVNNSTRNFTNNFTKNLAMVITLIAFSLLSLTNIMAQSVRLEEGTVVRLKLMQDLNSGTAQPGQTIAFEVLDNVVIDGKTIIAEGAPGLGHVVDAEPKKSFGRAGKLTFQLEYVKAVDGSKIPVRATSVSQGDGKGLTTGVAVGVSALVFFPAAPAFLLIKGKNISVPKGQHIDAFIDGTRVLQLREEPAVSASSGFGLTTSTPVSYNSSSANNNSANVCTINVVSEPGGGDIEIDGVFFGTAPTVVKIPVGQHTVTVKRNGYTPWQRTVTLVPGNITLKVELEVAPTRASARRK